MKSTRFSMIASVVAMTGAFALAAATTQPTSDTRPTLDDFTVLSERNMFMRDRPRPRVYERRTPSSRPTERYDTPEAIERYTVLRGVVIEDNELHAYVENTHTGVVRKLATGDTIGGGRVADIAIDAVQFENDGRFAWVEIGQNLRGARVEAPASMPATTMPADAANLSVLERMKLRRQQEHAH
ncbi:MAG: hypothetical protein ACTHM6_18890 [Tepidisphaeraceae bacterium]